MSKAKVSKESKALAFTIESGITIPPIARGGMTRESEYPFSALKPGDSFFVPFAEDEMAKGRRRIQGAVTAANKRSIGKFTMRSVDGGARVWRSE